MTTEKCLACLQDSCRETKKKNEKGEGEEEMNMTG